MKRISVLIAIAALGSPAFFIAPVMAAQPAGGVTPSACTQADAKTNHPDWFRDGGFCMLQYNGYQQNIL